MLFPPRDAKGVDCLIGVQLTNSLLPDFRRRSNLGPRVEIGVECEYSDPFAVRCTIVPGCILFVKVIAAKHLTETIEPIAGICDP
jgi:hypothetical protein